MEKKLLGHLVINSGPKKGESLELFSDLVLTLGRSSENDLIILDEVVSRQHAEIFAGEDGLHFCNFGRNGSEVNHRLVRSGEQVRLQHSDRIMIGSYELLIKLPQCNETQVLSRAMLEQPFEDGFKTMLLAPPLTAAINKKENRLAATNHLKPKLQKAQDQIKTKPKKLNVPLPKTTVSRISVGLTLLIVVMYLLPSRDDTSSAASKNDQQTDPAVALLDSVSVPPPEPPIEMQGPVPQAELRKGLALFGAAAKLFAERKLRERNLYDSIQKWQAGIRLLGKYSERPERDCTVALDNLRVAKTILENQFKDWQDELLISYKQRDYPNAQRLVQKILAAIPDFNDPRHRWAKDQENEIKQILKRGR